MAITVGQAEHQGPWASCFILANETRNWSKVPSKIHILYANVNLSCSVSLCTVQDIHKPGSITFEDFAVELEEFDDRRNCNLNIDVLMLQQKIILTWEEFQSSYYYYYYYYNYWCDYNFFT